MLCQRNAKQQTVAKNIYSVGKTEGIEIDRSIYLSTALLIQYPTVVAYISQITVAHTFSRVARVTVQNIMIVLVGNNPHRHGTDLFERY